MDHDVSETAPGGSLNMSEPPWDEIQVRKPNGVGGAVRPKFKSWLHCLALGKCLSHSVPEFPVFTKLIPMTIKHLLCAKHFYLWLLPQPALRRLEVVSSPPFYKQITKTWWGWRLVPPSPGESHAARLCCGPCCRGNLNAESDIIYSQLQPACDVM